MTPRILVRTVGRMEFSQWRWGDGAGSRGHEFSFQMRKLRERANVASSELPAC